MPITTRNTNRTLIAIAALGLSAMGLSATAPSAWAQTNEFCVECREPSATYRCQAKVSDKIRSLLPNNQVLQLACVKDITRAYGHGRCGVRDAGDVCPGAVVSVDLTAVAKQYVKQLPASIRPKAERALAKQTTPAEPKEPPAPADPDAPPKTIIEMAKRTAESTEKQLESADKAVQDAGKAVQKSMQKTWRCLTSGFQDC